MYNQFRTPSMLNTKETWSIKILILKKKKKKPNKHVSREKNEIIINLQKQWRALHTELLKVY